ncbi:MAG: TRAP transporter small permease subunit [Alphaproteobacteria bacterium]|nr:TRAP transporter small permease subunit [Alphaproteobacteria bacterium]
MISFLDGLHRIEKLLAAIAYMVVTGLLLTGIAAREFFSTAIWGSEKMAVFAAIFAAFLGLTLTTAANAHLRPRFTDEWWPAAWQTAVARLGDLLSAVIFIATGIIATIYVMDTYANQDRAIILYWPLWIIQAVIPYAFFSSGVRHLAFTFWPGLKPQPDNLES